MSFQVSNLFISSYDQTSLVKVAFKGSDQTISNDNTYNDDADLLVAVEANSAYMIDLWWIYSSDAVADIKQTFKAITGATASWNIVTGTAPNGLTDNQLYAGAGVGTKQCYHVKGVLKTGANAGNLQIRWAQNTADASNTTVYAETALTVTKVE